MIVTAWNNGNHYSTGAGYGIKLSIEDRDCYFEVDWKTINLYLGQNNQPVQVNVDKPSFWNQTCRELVHKEIGQWLISENLAHWEKRNPPKLTLTPIIDNQFRLTK